MLTLLLLILVTMEKNEEKVLGIIADSNGRTITEVVGLSGFPRSVVRILLARLDGAGKISFRKIGMSKLYSVGDES